MSEDKKARTFTDLLQEHHIDDVLEGEVIEEILLSDIKPNPFNLVAYLMKKKLMN